VHVEYLFIVLYSRILGVSIGCDVNDALQSAYQEETTGCLHEHDGGVCLVTADHCRLPQTIADYHRPMSMFTADQKNSRKM